MSKPAFASYGLRNIPAFTHYNGVSYPARVDLVLIDNRGLRWEGGEFATREEAIAEGKRKTGQA